MHTNLDLSASQLGGQTVHYGKHLRRKTETARLMPFLQRDTLQKEHSVLEKRKSRAEALLAAEHSQSTKIDRPPSHNLNPVTRYEEICADSWNRNNIVEARVPVQKADININASDNAKTEVYKTVLDDKHGTRDLELCCDCGTTFKVTGDNLNRIKVKSVTNNANESGEQKE